MWEEDRRLDEDHSKWDLPYQVNTFIDRLSSAKDVALSSLLKAKNKMKSWNDHQSTRLWFNVGDKVLSMLPIPGAVLQARYYGLYTVFNTVSDFDYVINTPDR